MTNRIFLFIESQQLTPTEFADKIGVSRAAISSIKTGRTQPTLTLVEKIKQHFPDVDINWLIFGEGDFGPKKQSVQDLENTLFEMDELQVSTDTDILKKDNLASEHKVVYIAEQPQIQEEKIEDIVRQKDSKSKVLKKVILLYDDGSFDEFAK